MCGISGTISFQQTLPAATAVQLATSLQALIERGPDGGGQFLDDYCALGHRRLSILDVSEGGTQPMHSACGRYVIVFNGEIFNYRELRQTYFAHDQDWKGNSDTEVLLKLLIQQGLECLHLLQGFFAFALWDKTTKTLLLARDRYGKKPLYFFSDQYGLCFASTLKGVRPFRRNWQLDANAIWSYLQLNYVPPGQCILQDVHQLPVGGWLSCQVNGTQRSGMWYELATIVQEQPKFTGTYAAAQTQLQQLIESAVKARMISDVPLGAFLSGGVDSSIVCALAAKHTPLLHTFSIGYVDAPFFDETKYARAVAAHIGADHTVFSLTTTDFKNYLPQMLKAIDEPFADSSALPVFILSQLTREHVTVALSGDGGDEVFAGYNKHGAEYKMRHPGWKEQLIGPLAPITAILPKSRNNPLTNLFRQIDRFAAGATLSAADRYRRWATYLEATPAKQLLAKPLQAALAATNPLLQLAGQPIQANRKDLDDFLLADMQLVLPGDMLVKVDRMSMASGLEVRSPLLDHAVVEFAFSLPGEWKIDGKMKKKILQDSFRHQLPALIYNRPKKGFEIPLLDWFRGDLKTAITQDWLSTDRLQAGGVFDITAVQQLQQQLYSNNPGDSVATIWALIVFQHWQQSFDLT